jgi:hypothetical protein
VLVVASYLVDFLLHSISLMSNPHFILTNVDLESTHVFAIEVVFGILGIAIIVILNESVGTLLEIREGVRYLFRRDDAQHIGCERWSRRI